MILAAGKGTRLKPLTDYKPKALVEINGVPLLEIIITRLIRQGIRSFTINIHHFPDQILQFLNSKQNFGVPVAFSDESTLLLDSGGGIHKASALFPNGEDVLIYNVDVISNIIISNIYKYHKDKNALATLAVRNRITQRYYLFNEQNQLRGWENINTAQQLLVNNPEEKYIPLAFSGISILSSSFIQAMKRDGCYPVRDEFLSQAVTNRIFGYLHDIDYWIDVGKPQQLQEAENFLRDHDNFF